MNYCSNCSNTLKSCIPPGDDRPRFLCDACGTIHYENPKMVVGCIPEFEDKILLCRRSIEPCFDKWTLPAGYLENGETVSAGATREACSLGRDVRLLPVRQQAYGQFGDQLVLASSHAVVPG